MTFRQYLRQSTPLDYCEADFTVDALADRGFPAVKRWSELRDYLYWERNACDGAMVGAARAWRRYLRFRRQVKR
jgi:hypothetical protein